MDILTESTVKQVQAPADLRDGKAQYFSGFLDIVNRRSPRRYSERVSFGNQSQESDPRVILITFKEGVSRFVGVG